MAGLDEQLAVAITQKLRAVDFQTALLLQDQTGKTLTFNEETVFPSASLIKIGIAVYINDVWQKQPEILAEKMVVKSEQRVAGAGVMHHLAQEQWSLRDVLALMLATSDNTAANMLLDYFGQEKINDWLGQNFPGLQVQRHFIAPVIAGRDNFLTAAALLPAWQRLFTKENEFTAVCQTAVHEQVERGKLVYYADDLGFTGETYNKTGDLANVEHDCARFLLGEEWFDCILLTKFSGADQHQAALGVQREVGRLLLEKLMA